MNAPPDNPVILEARGISKAFPGVRALSGVDFRVYAGMLNAVVGENGAGKSTLMKILAGVYAPDGGELFMDGERIVLRNASDALARRIAIIHQELQLAPHMSIAENVFLGREFCTAFGTIDDRRMNAETARLLEMLKLNVDPRTPVFALRVGQQQIVEIAKALSIDARVIIMDEPTSAIGEQEIELLFGLIADLKRRGVGIVYITHKLDELCRIGDRVTVLRDGAWIGEGSLEELDPDAMVKMMIGRDLTEMYSTTPSTPRGEVLRVEHASLRHPERPEILLVDDVSFDVNHGEVVGLFGLMGAGRTELFETIFGLHPDASRGEVWIEGVKTNVRSPRDAIAAGIGFASEDRKLSGLVLNMSVAENVSMASLPKVERMFMLNSRLENEMAERHVAGLNIKTPSIHRCVENLSGGNRQKVVLAKWLSTEPRVLLLDEPTRGIDISAKKEIYGVISDLTSKGLGVAMVSSELPELLGVSDRIIVMAEGRKTAEYTRAEATEEKVLRAALPRRVLEIAVGKGSIAQ